MRAESDNAKLFALREQGGNTGQHQYQSSHLPRILQPLHYAHAAQRG
jgi:hypothetical protein